MADSAQVRNEGLLPQHLSNCSGLLSTLQDSNQAEDAGRSFATRPPRVNPVSKAIFTCREPQRQRLMMIQLKAKFKVGNTVWMKNPSTGNFEWRMTVVDGKYDESRPGWNYQVKDQKGVLYSDSSSGWVLETVLKD